MKKIRICNFGIVCWIGNLVSKILAKIFNVVYGCPTIPQDDGDDDNPNETMCVYFFLPLYAAFIIF